MGATGRPRDPVPGDPYALADPARHYPERAGTMRGVIDGLRRVDAGDQESEAVRVLAEWRDDLIPRPAWAAIAFFAAVGVTAVAAIKGAALAPARRSKRTPQHEGRERVDPLPSPRREVAAVVDQVAASLRPPGG